MSENETVLAVVIGRAGSKGLHGKNSRLLAGRPMICHTIDDAREATSVTRVIVSTDGAAIAQAAQSMGVMVVHRPATLATDTATVDSAVRHAVESIDAAEPIIVILYANVPVRPAGLIDRAVDLLIESKADSVQSYSDVGKCHPHWMVRLDEEGHVQPHVENAVYRRQDLPKLLIPNGGVIAIRRRSLFKVIQGQPHAFLGKDRRGIETPAGSVIDVDTPADLALAEATLSARFTKPEKLAG